MPIEPDTEVLSSQDCCKMYSHAARACFGDETEKDYTQMDRMIRGLAALSNWDEHQKKTDDAFIECVVKKAAKEIVISG